MIDAPQSSCFSNPPNYFLVAVIICFLTVAKRYAKLLYMRHPFPLSISCSCAAQELTFFPILFHATSTSGYFLLLLKWCSHGEEFERNHRSSLSSHQPTGINRRKLQADALDKVMNG